MIDLGLWLCRLGIHDENRSQGCVGHCGRRCGDLKLTHSDDGMWTRYITAAPANFDITKLVDSLPEGPAENQHDPAVDAHSTGTALLKALRYWQGSGCDCCSPTICDEAIESLGLDVELWEGFRRFGIELAQTAQNVIDSAQEDDNV